jgi:hypothetical protein
MLQQCITTFYKPVTIFCSWTSRGAGLQNGLKDWLTLIGDLNPTLSSSSCLLLFWFFFLYYLGFLNKKLKQSRNRPGVAQRVPGGLGSQISWHSEREGGDVVNLTHRPPLPPGMFLALIFTRGWVDPRDMVRSEGNMSLKNPVTLPGIDSGTFRLVAQRLNHYATPDPTFS